MYKYPVILNIMKQLLLLLLPFLCLCCNSSDKEYEDYSKEDGSGSDLSDENVDGVDSGETNQEDLTEDGMQQNESNADGSEDVIGGTEDAQ